MTTQLKGAALQSAINAAEKALPPAVADVAALQRKLTAALEHGCATDSIRQELARAIQRRQECHAAISAVQQQAEQRHHEKVAAVADALIAGANAHITALINRYSHTPEFSQ